jgi:tetratricopeptide (TPR) repeat protein
MSGSDPLQAARDKLFPALGNKTLAAAADALARDHVEKAEALTSGFLRKKPQEPAALNLMADIARRAERFDDAEQLLSRCVAFAPDTAGYRFNLAVILRRREKYEEALSQLDILLSLDPGNLLFQEQKAAILSLIGRHAEALRYRKALSDTCPLSADAWLAYGQALGAFGAADECIDAYHRALELAPSSSAPYVSLADLKTYRFRGEEITRMEQLLAGAGLPAGERADLHSALGKACGDEKYYAKAFDNYAKGNALRRLGSDFDPGRLAAHRLNCESLFTREFFEARIGWGCPSREPIFIVGMPRSGSTLLEQILCTHSAIEGMGERADLDLVVGRFMSGKNDGRQAHEFWIGGKLEFRAGLIEAFSPVVAGLAFAEARSLGEEYLVSISARRATKRPFFSDKGLRNFGYVGLIHLVLPNAKIIDVRRHPLDCGWSCFRSHFPGGQPFATKLGDIGQHYANYSRLMTHFHAVLPGRIHTVIYEKLIADPEGELRRLFDYLELPFEEQCLRFHETRRIAGTLSSQQVRTPLYRSGVDQWRPYEQWLGPLKSALAETLHEYPRSPY